MTLVGVRLSRTVNWETCERTAIRCALPLRRLSARAFIPTSSVPTRNYSAHPRRFLDPMCVPLVNEDGQIACSPRDLVPKICRTYRTSVYGLHELSNNVHIASISEQTNVHKAYRDISCDLRENLPERKGSATTACSGMMRVN